MLRKIVLFLIMILFSLILSCHQKSAEVVPKKLTVVATIFPVYDFARNIGGEKIEITMLLPPGIDVHHYELKPVDIVKATQCDIFLFTNFEMENWAYQIIRAASKNRQCWPSKLEAVPFFFRLQTTRKLPTRIHQGSIRTSGWIWTTQKNGG